ncbi:MAG: hypothetical protein ACFFAO_19810, partial [Candidatus Hermodarchaeota archaeon]
MKVFNVSGTQGDTYTNCCKLINIKENIKLIHIQPFPELNNIIRKIYSLVPNIVDITIINTSDESKFDPRIPRIHSQSKKYLEEPDYIEMNFFPNFEFKSDYNFKFPYLVLQPKAGQEFQKREMKLKLVKKIIKDSKYKVILIGTSKKYEKVNNCINLINKTSYFDAFSIIKNAKYFIGVMGIMAMVALSHKVNCNIIIDNDHEIKVRIKDMPWENYIKKMITLTDYLKMESTLIYKLKTHFYKFI